MMNDDDNPLPIEIIKGRLREFEYTWADQLAAAAVDIPSGIHPQEGERVEPTGFRLLFRPDQGTPEERRGLWLSPPPGSVGMVRLVDAPAELLFRAIPLLVDLELALRSRSGYLTVLAAGYVMDWPLD